MNFSGICGIPPGATARSANPSRPRWPTCSRLRASRYGCNAGSAAPGDAAGAASPIAICPRGDHERPQACPGDGGSDYSSRGAGGILLEVADDGQGFDVDSRGDVVGHFGIRGMRERTRRINAEMTIDSSGAEALGSVSESHWRRSSPGQKPIGTSRNPPERIGELPGQELADGIRIRTGRRAYSPRSDRRTAA